MVWIRIHQLLEKEIAFVISQQIVFQEFFMGFNVPQGNLGIIIDETHILMDVGMIYEPGIIGQIKVTPTPPVGRVEEMTQ